MVKVDDRRLSGAEALADIVRVLAELQLGRVVPEDEAITKTLEQLLGVRNRQWWRA